MSSINYASAVWVPGGVNDVKRIESLQYQMARAILKAPRNTPLECLLGDLGWQPISIVQNNLRMKYLDRIRKLPDTRWPNLMFNVMHSLYVIKCKSNSNNLRWKWFVHIDHTLGECGMGHLLSHNRNRNWINEFVKISIDNANKRWLDSAKCKSSLRDYILIKRKPSLENYLLCKQDFYGAAMKFKARSNTLPLNSRVHKWKPNVNINCPLCNNGIDDLRHFLFLCSSLNHIRTEEFLKLEDRLLRLNLEPFWSLFISGNLTVKVCLMLGLSDDILSVNDNYPLLSTFDVFCKSYLKRAWTARTSCINSV